MKHGSIRAQAFRENVRDVSIRLVPHRREREGGAMTTTKIINMERYFEEFLI